ncbi:PAS and ANTAR domain-containing protein [Nocardia brasiliensis]|uniref:histidine kinase n=1 Tax=Nocardia brasiliensis (strain ATCC 700358 / HUJEG-1) TaxID=1133849 RepID=K0F6L7_NOCB7|nr:PAS and ANTAR domain-containing protein [Nocardia brasiliensis]AFU03106.1 transcription antitermination regulator [Nocardia brasiliensis ATCC 700358]OCF87007.1 antitermination regulator [Nocardia brasiliensis]
MGPVQPENALALDRVIGLGTPQSVGSFRFWFADQRWDWSDEVAAMHGYAPGTVTPTTELLLTHKHPDDRAQVASALAKSIEEGEPFSSRHRILDTLGRVHHVIVVADHLFDHVGAVVGTSGYYIDVTETLEEHRQEALDDALPELWASRAVIEQAKGAVMLVYGVNAEQAFRVLSWRSQETNIKLRTLASRLVADLESLTNSTVGLRTQFDHLLLTAHERIDAG